jgi:uncharacterized protein
MSRIAVIGAGISGLAAAYYLSRKHEVTLFEREPRLGGHTHTVIVESSQGPLPIDTGFIVHNQRTYPNFCRLIQELGVATQPSDMSFAVTSPGGAFEYSSRGVGGFFAQYANVLRPSHYGLLREILRFNREAPQLLNRPAAESMTLSGFLEDGRYGAGFVERYLYPMAAAVWSMAPEDLGAFPALTLVRFFQNHGMLGIATHPQWLTICGGSHAYIPPLTAPYRDRIHTGVQIRSVTRGDAGVRLSIAGRHPLDFDEVVFGCHGDQVLPLLADATDRERDVLANFQTSRNEACLHTDVNLLPRRPQARASWNYLLGDNGKVAVTYHMNRLQALSTREDYCVTLNANGAIAEDRSLKRMVYHHPVFDRAAVRAQQRWGEISGQNHTHFCGAYWFYGFHEDGVRSALRVAASLGAQVS